MPSFNQFLESILMGMGGGRQAQAAPMPQSAPVPVAPPVMPPQRPSPPAPQASLPGGSFAPNRQTLPGTAPIPTPRPQAVAPAVAAAQQRPNPLVALLSGGGAGGDWRKMLRAAGAGMANLSNTGGDPFLAFGQGFGGATGHYDERDAAAAEASVEAERTAYERSQDSADLELRRAAEARQAKRAEMENQKTAAELARLAKQKGLTVSQMLEIERIAQAAGEAEYDPERRRKIVEQERERLIEQFTEGDERSGLSEKSGGLSNEEVTATGPNGEKIVLRDGQWVPLNGE